MFTKKKTLQKSSSVYLSFFSNFGDEWSWQVENTISFYIVYRPIDCVSSQTSLTIFIFKAVTIIFFRMCNSSFDHFRETNER